MYLSVLIIIIFIIYIYIHKKVNHNVYKPKSKELFNNCKKFNNCQKNILNTYNCFLNSCDLCPMGSFKQCSNNYSYKTYPPNTKFDCFINYDLLKSKYSEKCLLHNKICNNWYQEEKNEVINYPPSNPRVNMWRTPKSKYSEFMINNNINK